MAIGGCCAGSASTTAIPEAMLPSSGCSTLPGDRRARDREVGGVGDTDVEEANLQR